ncbi:RNA-guided pseudouridylation complex pseudouridine synthase subunit Cbf5 [Candidatus Pacearchaeota archaeon]|nr:RNA-guided pseudouridylation complex pseudouridine synthase subunit Cbf5 [Candidatus Pacearchaeota archaeon]
MQKPINEILDFCLINIDKPADYTSHDVVAKIKKILNAKRAGHCGTLDPMVTGVLPLLINRSCRLSNYFMKKDKKYIGKMLLHADISEEELKKHMKEFIGKIMQKPPVRSKVKRVLRERNVHEFKIIKKDGKIVEFESDVEAGTYIRKLISDLGEKIGGAHMIELRRTKAGIFDIKDSFKIEDIEKAFKDYENENENELRKILIPAEIIQTILSRVDIKEGSLNKLLHGKPLMKEDLINNKLNKDLFCVFCKERFVGVYKSIKEENEDIVARAQFVMD